MKSCCKAAKPGTPKLCFGPQAPKQFVTMALVRAEAQLRGTHAGPQKPMQL